MTDLAAAFDAVVGALERSGLDYVVVGSTAAAGWGVARTTRDVDVVMQLDHDAADGFLESLDRDDLYVPPEAARDALLRGGSFNVLHTSTGGKIDVFVVAPDDEFERSRLARRVSAHVLGLASWVATAEDVILSKLRWRLDSRSEVQWRDCVEIAAVQELDHPYLWRWAPVLGVVDDLAELLGEEPPPTS